MAVQKLGVLPGSASPQQNHRQLPGLAKNQNHGLMAFSFRRKNLACFYCNRKSNIKYDGQLRSWDCDKCDSTNYLDENGEITDPPVATDYAAPNNLRYTIPRPESLSFQTSDSSTFCDKCKKNQHLYTASLAQYHIETDPHHPQYRESERKFFEFKKTLERTYPQVCVDCEPIALKGLREAAKIVKEDHIRVMNEKSRANRLGLRTRNFTFVGALELAGGWLYYGGLLGQLLWNLVALLAVRSYISQEDTDISSSNYATETIESIIKLSTSETWAFSSLFCSAVSIWWMPMFNQVNNGFMRHIKGIRDWYKLQFVSILVRSLFYYTMGTGVFASQLSAATIGAHIVLLFFTIAVAIRARRTVKIDMTPLWSSTPEKLPFVGPRSQSPNANPQSMADALDQILATPSRGSRQISPPSSTLPTPPLNPGTLNRGMRNYQQLSPIRPSTPLPERSTPPLSEMTEQEVTRYLRTGETPSRLQPKNSQLDADDMEWSPSLDQSPYRAFNPARALQHRPQTFGETPVGDNPSPFWFKVPPAPITPARKIRNPPNQPRLLVASQEAKENFFNNVTQKKSAASVDDVFTAPVDSQKRDIEFAQQKFFAPIDPSEEGNVLVDLLSTFSLGGPDTDTATTTEGSSKLRHVFQGLALFLGLVFWNYSLSHPYDNTTYAMPAVMTVCLVIGIRTILDNTVLGRSDVQKAASQTIGTCLGGLEVGAAGFGLVEIASGRGRHENIGSLGTVLIGAMLVHEVWLASFGH